MASRLALSESTVPTAKILVPAAGEAVSPFSYVVEPVVWMVRWKPSRSVIVIVLPDTDTTVPARCGGCCRSAGGSGAAVPDADGDDVDGDDADRDADGEGAEAAAATPPPMASAAATVMPATTSGRRVRRGGDERVS